MLKNNEFVNWALRLELPEQTQKIINTIRNSEPARRVRSGKGAVSGTFPSQKMGVTIQFESHKNELPFIQELEHNDDVLEFYDQAPTFKIEYESKNARKVVTNHTPDFFVIERNTAYWVECKTEGQLLELAVKQPNRYKLNQDGIWECPPGREYAFKYGLDYRVQSDEFINWTYQRNIEFLDDYYRSENKEISKNSQNIILNNINDEIGISLAEIFDKTAGLVSKDEIYQLIASNVIFVNFKEALLTKPEEVFVFSGYESYKAFSNSRILDNSNFIDNSNSIILVEGTYIEWDTKIYKILNVGNQCISLMSQHDEFLEIPNEVFDKLLRKGKVKAQTSQKNNSKKEEIKKALSRASEKDCAVANKRLRAVLAKLNDEDLPDDINVSDRTLYRWINNHENARQVFGNGYIGLLPKPNPGNRKDKLPSEVKDLLDNHLEKSYKTPKQKTIIAVCGEFNLVCEEKGLTTVSYKAVRKAVKKLIKKDTILKRKGKRAAYKHQEFYWELSQTTPRHGERPFHIAHIDHTTLDIEIVDSKTGKVLGRIYLTLLMDAFSRRVLAFYLSFERPSKVSCMMVLRECVKRHGRLPQIIIVDGGKEFSGVYFETLLAIYECTKKTRPPAEPRFGSILERLFGATNTRFIYNLQGNTQITKNVREVTKSVNPKNLAIWTLPKFHEYLSKWFYEIYDSEIEHPALNKTPREEFLEGIDKFGKREVRFISYDENFKILTLPSIQRREVKVSSERGVRVHNINYFCDEFRHPESNGLKVAVRYDPLDVGIVYAFIRKRWVKCYSEYYKVFKGRSEKELNIAAEEIKRNKTLFGKSRKITAAKLARFLMSAEGEEVFLTQRMRDMESRQINESINRGEADVSPIVVETPKESEISKLEKNQDSPLKAETSSLNTKANDDFLWYGRL